MVNEEYYKIKINNFRTRILVAKFGNENPKSKSINTRNLSHRTVTNIRPTPKNMYNRLTI